MKMFRSKELQSSLESTSVYSSIVGLLWCDHARWDTSACRVLRTEISSRL